MARTEAVLDDISAPPDTLKTSESDHEDQLKQPKSPDLAFFEMISKFTDADWEKHIVYIYRLAPITDRLAGGTLKYLMKYGSRFDQDTIKADHGSGRYRLQLNQLGPKGSSKTIRTQELDIEDMNFPAKVPDGEWMDDPRNKRWAWGRKKPEAQAPATDSTSLGKLTDLIGKLVENRQNGRQDSDEEKKLSGVLVDWALKQTATEKNEGSAGKLAELVKAIKDLMPAPVTPAAVVSPLAILAEAKALFATTGKSDPMVELLMQELKSAREESAKERQRNHELQMKMMEQKATAADPLDMVNKVLNLQEKLGGGERSRRPGWPGLLEDHADRLLDLGERALGAIAYKRAQPAPAPVQQQRPQQQQPQPASTVQAQQPAQPTNQEPQQPMPNTPSDPDIAFLLTIFEAQGRLFVSAFINDPVAGGGAVARTVSLFGGVATYERIARMGQDKILATIELLPEMKADLLKAGTLEMLKEFIDDFIAGPEDPDDDEDDEDDGPVIPEGRVRPRKPKKAEVVPA